MKFFFKLTLVRLESGLRFSSAGLAGGNECVGRLIPEAWREKAKSLVQ